MISFLAGTLSILAGCIGTVTFFYLRPKIWIRKGQPLRKEPKEVTINEIGSIIPGKVFIANVKNITMPERKSVLHAKSIGNLISDASIGTPIVVVSKYEHLIDKVTRFDVYHPRIMEDKVDRFIEKAAVHFGFYLVREQEAEKLKEQVNGGEKNKNRH